jgi:hypothetical protein
MTFDASHALRFINRARAASGLPALAELPFAGSVRVDERACVLARALQGEIGGSADPGWSERFVVRLGDQTRARAVAGLVGQPYNDRGEVLLPEPLVRLAVGFDRGLLGRRAATYVAPGQMSFDDLVPGVCQEPTRLDDSSPATRPHASAARPPRRGRAGAGCGPRAHHLRRPPGVGPAERGPGRNGCRPGRTVVMGTTGRRLVATPVQPAPSA